MGLLCTQYTARADHLLSQTSKCMCLHVSTTLPHGCWPTVCSWTLARPTCSGVQQLIIVISCPRQLFESSPTFSTHRSQSEISEFTSTLTSACDATFRKSLPVALRFCISCAAFYVQCRRLSTRCLSLLSSCPDCTTAMLCWYNHLQSVLNAAAWSIAGLQHSDHIIDTLASFRWLRAPECVQFKLATIIFQSLNGMAPSYLAADLRFMSDMTSKWHLQSSLTHQLDVPKSQCATVGDQAFAVAGDRLWSSLHWTLSHPISFHSSTVNWEHFCLNNPIHLYFCRDLHFYLWS